MIGPRVTGAGYPTSSERMIRRWTALARKRIKKAKVGIDKYYK
jgi:hypothetical protein